LAIINRRSGCKVGWVTFDNEEEAREFAAKQAEPRARALAQGYDFGYQWPGTVEQAREYVDSHDTSKGFVLLDEWIVCTP